MNESILKHIYLPQKIDPYLLAFVIWKDKLKIRTVLLQAVQYWSVHETCKGLLPFSHKLQNKTCVELCEMLQYIIHEIDQTLYFNHWRHAEPREVGLLF